MKIATLFGLFFLTSLGITSVVQAQTNTQAQASTQIRASTQTETYHSFLRINKVYVLYTDPIIPHQDKQGNFWVGLSSFLFLLGGKTHENKNTQTAWASFQGHTIIFKSGAKTAKVGRHTLTLSAHAKLIGPKQLMVVPLAALAKAFGLHTQFNKRYQVLTFTDPELINQSDAGDFVNQLRDSTGPPYSLGPIVPIVVKQKGSNAEWTLKNLSSQNFPSLFMAENASGYNYFDGGMLVRATTDISVPTYSVPAHGTLNYQFSINGRSSHKPVRYLVYWPLHN